MIKEDKNKIVIEKWGENVHFLNALQELINFYEKNRNNALIHCDVDIAQNDDMRRSHDPEETFREHYLDIDMRYADIKYTGQGEWK